ncbi:hypothetical protein P692DRAFT_20864804 [Suillus brevipes Sb2]|nr:hypothetical protein P692DRAFT_20864804 [Suillus brevipes Sb2]
MSFPSMAFLSLSVFILSPLVGTSVSSGNNITVTFQKPNLCAPQAQALGEILYSGPFNPRVNFKQPSQDFNIRIPHTTSNGSTLLTVTHFALIGPCDIFCNGASLAETGILLGVPLSARTDDFGQKKLAQCKHDPSTDDDHLGNPWPPHHVNTFVAAQGHLI